MTTISTGNVVRYTGKFIKSMGYCFPNGNDYHGEVTAIRGRIARVLWQDDHESSCLLSNIEKYPPERPTNILPVPDQDDITIMRGELLAKAWLEMDFPTAA